MIKKIISIFLVFVMIFVSIPYLPNNESSALSVNDTVFLKKVADGTHKGPGTETFVNYKHGYAIGDNTVDDGVVTSGDYVTYNYKMSISAGPARKIVVTFKQTGDGLDYGGLKNTIFDLGSVSYTVEGNTITYNVPRGATAMCDTSINLKAVDTKGQIIKDNVLSAELKEEDYEYKTKAEPVTVVSVPLADLMLEDAYNTTSYSQNASYGCFYIKPYTLALKGYPSTGLISSSEWHTDVDVSSFPSGTVFKHDSTVLPVVDGKLLDLKGTDAYRITYTLPQAVLPTSGVGSKSYTIKLLPREDSFSKGDSKNIKDIGADEDIDYNTKEVELYGTKTDSRRGVNTPNNNYLVHYWYYSPAPTGSTWGHTIVRPNIAYGDTYLDESGIKFSDTAPYFKQGDTYPYRVYFSNELYSRTEVDLSKASQPSEKVIVAGTIEKASSTRVDAEFDNSRPVVVLLDDQVLPVDDYTVEWRLNEKDPTNPSDNVYGTSRWAESNIPLTYCNQWRVRFRSGVFSFGSNAKGNLSVRVPMKTKSYYPSSKDGLSIVSTGSFYYSRDGSLSNLYGNTCSDYVTLAIPKEPSLKAGSYFSGDVELDKKSNRFVATFFLEDTIVNPLTLKDYTPTWSLRFDESYDLSTFSIDDSLYNYSVSGNTVTVTTKSPFTLYRDGSMKTMKFSVKTRPNLRNQEFNGFVTETLSVPLKAMYNIRANTLTGTKTCNVKYTGSDNSSSLSEAQSKYREVNEDITFNVKSTITGEGISQTICLPSNGDSFYMKNIVNRNNGTNIDIDPDTGRDKTGVYDGIGRSKFSGKYKIKSIVVKNAGPDLKILISGSDDMRLNHKNGVVDVDDLSIVEGRDRPKLYLISKQPATAMQNHGFDVSITIEPIGNKKGDVYLVWPDKVLEVGGDGSHSPKVAWPSYTEITASSISGKVWRDLDANGNVDTSETGFSNVSIDLLKKGTDGNYSLIKQTKTKSDGSYTFEDLAHGNYQVALPKVKRKEGFNPEVLSINGSKDADASDGDLTLGIKNRFGVFVPLKQTCSYPSLKGAQSNTVSDVTLGYADNRADVSFGFFNPIMDLALDESKATVIDQGDTVKLSYNVTVKNTSNDVIDGVRLTNVADKQLRNVTASIGHTIVKPNGLKPLKLIGDSFVLTEDGLYFIHYPGWGGESFSDFMKERHNVLYEKVNVSNDVIKNITYSSDNFFASGNKVYKYVPQNIQDNTPAKLEVIDFNSRPLLFFDGRLVQGNLFKTVDGYYEYRDGKTFPINVQSEYNIDDINDYRNPSVCIGDTDIGHYSHYGYNIIAIDGDHLIHYPNKRSHSVQRINVGKHIYQFFTMCTFFDPLIFISSREGFYISQDYCCYTDKLSYSMKMISDKPFKQFFRPWFWMLRHTPYLYFLDDEGIKQLDMKYCEDDVPERDRDKYYKKVFDIKSDNFDRLEYGGDGCFVVTRDNKIIELSSSSSFAPYEWKGYSGRILKFITNQSCITASELSARHSIAYLLTTDGLYKGVGSQGKFIKINTSENINDISLCAGGVGIHVLTDNSVKCISQYDQNHINDYDLNKLGTSIIEGDSDEKYIDATGGSSFFDLFTSREGDYLITNRGIWKGDSFNENVVRVSFFEPSSYMHTSEDSDGGWIHQLLPSNKGLIQPLAVSMDRVTGTSMKSTDTFCSKFFEFTTEGLWRLMKDNPWTYDLIVKSDNIVDMSSSRDRLGYLDSSIALKDCINNLWLFGGKVLQKKMHLTKLHIPGNILRIAHSDYAHIIVVSTVGVYRVNLVDGTYLINYVMPFSSKDDGEIKDVYVDGEYGIINTNKKIYTIPFDKDQNYMIYNIEGNYERRIEQSLGTPYILKTSSCIYYKPCVYNSSGTYTSLFKVPIEGDSRYWLSLKRHLINITDSSIVIYEENGQELQPRRLTLSAMCKGVAVDYGINELILFMDDSAYILDDSFNLKRLAYSGQLDGDIVSIKHGIVRTSKNSLYRAKLVDNKTKVSFTKINKVWEKADPSYGGSTYVADQGITPVSTTTKGDFNVRTYDLPKIAPGDSVVFHIEGFADKKKEKYVIANQSYVTSEKTPRKGLPNSGVEGVPNLPKAVLDSYDVEGIFGNMTATVNRSIDDDTGDHEDLADQVPAMISALVTDTYNIENGTLLGKAFIDKNKNGIDDDNSPAEGVEVTVYGNNDMEYGKVTTGPDGRWSLEGLMSNKTYKVHYNYMQYRKDGKVYVPTKRVNTSCEATNDSDVDSDGYSVEFVKLDSKSCLDCGLIPIKAHTNITTLSNTDNVVGDIPLSETLDYKFKVDYTNPPTLKSNNSFDDKDGDPRTLAYATYMTNDGELPLTNIRVSTNTTKGNSLKTYGEYYLCENSRLTPLIEKDGILYVNDDTKLVLDNGKAVVSYSSIPFTKDNATHSNTTTVVANALQDGRIINSVSDKQDVNVSYTYQAKKALNIHVLGSDGVSRDRTKATPLSDLTFDVYTVNDIADDDFSYLIEPTYAESFRYTKVGTYTSVNGNISLPLGAGVYKIVQKNNKMGYTQPSDEGWFVNLNPNSGYPMLAANSSMPYFTVSEASTATSWGGIDIYNYTAKNVPLTGSFGDLFSIAGGSLVLLGLIVVYKRRREY